ncbi:MAG: hypothetical protein HYW49_06910 [Deltaproteobacteria bacterium]|nr:hypothetical protein [Deltaproteobacteria bacterium]
MGLAKYLRLVRKTADLTFAPANVEQILKIISETKTGADVLARFTPHLRSGRIRIEGYPAEILDKLRAAKSSDQPVGASFVTDGKAGTIYVDLSSELGVLAPFLLHEMIHGLDEGIWDLARGNTRERGLRMLASEKTAFATQHRFLTELKMLHPGLESFLGRRYSGARILHEEMTEAAIRQLYDLEAA